MYAEKGRGRVRTSEVWSILAGNQLQSLAPLAWQPTVGDCVGAVGAMVVA